MPDNWGFVLAAYAIGALVLGGYWRRLRRRERQARQRPAIRRAPARPALSTHPRPDPGARP